MNNNVMVSKPKKIIKQRKTPYTSVWKIIQTNRFSGITRESIYRGSEKGLEGELRAMSFGSPAQIDVIDLKEVADRKGVTLEDLLTLQGIKSDRKKKMISKSKRGEFRLPIKGSVIIDEPWTIVEQYMGKDEAKEKIKQYKATFRIKGGDIPQMKVVSTYCKIRPMDWNINPFFYDIVAKYEY